MSHDAVITEISVNTDIQLQSSLLRKATLVDKIAIVGNVIFFLQKQDLFNNNILLRRKPRPLFWHVHHRMV